MNFVMLAFVVAGMAWLVRIAYKFDQQDVEAEASLAGRSLPGFRRSQSVSVRASRERA